MVKSGKWCANVFYNMCFLLLTYLAMPIASIAALFTNWDLGNQWVLDILKLTYAPDSNWEKALDDSGIWIFEQQDVYKKSAPKWDPTKELNKTEYKTFMSAFVQVSGGSKTCITIKKFEKYLSSDPSLDTGAKMDAYVAKINYQNDPGCINFTEFAKWMDGSSQ